MTTDFRALCVELTDCLEKSDWPHRYKVVFQQWMDIAHAALAEPDEPAVPQGREPAAVITEPSDEEVAELTGQLIEAANGTAAMGWDQHARSILRAAELLQRLSPPQPVAVSEGLPEPEDCLDEGWAWFFSPRVGWRQAVFPVSTAYTHWLPAYALPLPEVGE